MLEYIKHLFTKKYVVKFHLTSGTIIEVPNVIDCSTKTSTQTGELTAYNVTYAKFGKRPKFMTIPINSITAIVVD